VYFKILAVFVKKTHVFHDTVCGSKLSCYMWPYQGQCWHGSANHEI